MIEQLTGTTYSVLLPTGDRAEIGDILSPTFKPHLKLKRWGNECSLDLDLATNQKLTPKISGDKILWEGRDYGAEFYQAADGFKFNVILSKKPKTNVFPLDFGSNNLVFFYQPPLTEEWSDGWSDEFQTDIKVTETQVIDTKTSDILVNRPENVVGSYAVYHATKGNMHPSQAEAERYKCGKAFHWYRPLIFDSIGNKCWGELSVDPKLGIRTVTIPQSFLDNAIYPVTIDDTFGHDVGTHGAATYQSNGDYIRGTVYTCGAVGIATHISWYNVVGLYDDGPQRLGIYRDSDSGFVIGTGDVSSQPTDQYNTLAVTAPAGITAQDYILCHWGEEYSLAYDSIADKGRGQALGYPDTWPATATFVTDNFHYSLYCTYTPAGGGWANIGKVNGIAAASFSKMNGVAVADIAKVNGVAV